MKRLVPRPIALVTVSAAFAACAETTPPPDDFGYRGTGIAVSVAPLDLKGVNDACYSFEITNGLGQRIIARGEAQDPTGTGVAGQGGDGGPVELSGREAEPLCSSRFGDSGGAINYVAPCDATPGAATHTVTLWVNAVCQAGSLAGNTPCTPMYGYQNPCGSAGCQVTTTCIEDSDVPVRFDFTIMAAAQQGFFDIAVRFDEVYCSAKLDTCYEDNSSINLLFDDSGNEVATAVAAIACTAGVEGVDTHLFHTTFKATCGGTTYGLPLADVAVEGNTELVELDSSGVPVANGATLNAGVYFGTEALVNGPNDDPANKVFTNIAFVLPADGTPCAIDWLVVPSDSNDCPTSENGQLGTFRQVAGVSFKGNVGKGGACERYELDASGSAVSTSYIKANGSAGYSSRLDEDSQSFADPSCAASAGGSFVISGRVAAGPVAGAQVVLVSLDGGGNTTTLGQGLTGPTGNFSLSVPVESLVQLSASDDVVELRATGGSYLDEASLDTVTFGAGESMRARVQITDFDTSTDTLLVNGNPNPVTSGTTTLAVTPLTEMAAIITDSLVGQGSDLIEAVSTADVLVKESFGLDTIMLAPANIYDDALVAGSSESEYALALAGLSQLTQTVSAASAEAVSQAELAQSIAYDLSDGSIDGLVNASIGYETAPGQSAVLVHANVVGTGWGATFEEAIVDFAGGTSADQMGVEVPSALQEGLAAAVAEVPTRSYTLMNSAGLGVYVDDEFFVQRGPPDASVSNPYELEGAPWVTVLADDDSLPERHLITFEARPGDKVRLFARNLDTGAPEECRSVEDIYLRDNVTGQVVFWRQGSPIETAPDLPDDTNNVFFTVSLVIGGPAVSGSVGCSDGRREGFVNGGLYPAIAGCSGGFALPGAKLTMSPDCARQAGDDSNNPLGTGCNVSDLCAAGWHVCATSNEVSQKSGGFGCVDAVPPGAQLFFLTRQSGDGSGYCSASGTNDIFGCGTLGSDTPFDVSMPHMNCAPLNKFGHDQCAGLDVHGWTCADGAAGENEVNAVTHVSSTGGGVLCCKDAACTPSCTGRACGSDGCGGSCGTCSAGSTCNQDGQCVMACVPNCAGRMCGPDGCGGSCGSCNTGTCSVTGQCEPTCVPNCSGRMCGTDGCGGSCGSCTGGMSCNFSGQCMMSGPPGMP